MKPKHPCSIYNLFFQLERECIIYDLKQSSANKDRVDNDSSSRDGENVNHLSQDADQRPMRYRHLVLAKDWYKSGRSKRKHRKSDLPFGFRELNEIISKRWESVDEETKEYLKKIAAAEWKTYKAEKKKHEMENSKAFESKIIADYAADSCMATPSQTKDNCFNAGETYNSSQKRRLFGSMEQESRNIDSGLENNNRSLISKLINNKSNMISETACKSRHFSSYNWHSKYITAANNQYGEEFGEKINPSFEPINPSFVASDNIKFPMPNTLERGIGNSSNFSNNDVKLPTTSSRLKNLELDHINLFASYNNGKKSLANDLNGIKYFSMPNFQQSCLAFQLNTSHLNKKNMKNSQFCQDNLQTRFLDGNIFENAQPSYFMNNININSMSSFSSNQNIDSNGRPRDAASDNISSYLQGIIKQNDMNTPSPIDAFHQSMENSSFMAGTTMNHHLGCQNSSSIGSAQRTEYDYRASFAAKSSSVSRGNQLAGAQNSKSARNDDLTLASNDDHTFPDAFSTARFHPVQETINDMFDGNASLSSIDLPVEKTILVKTEDDEKTGTFDGDISLDSLDVHFAQPFSARFHPVDDTTLATNWNHSLGSIEFHPTHLSRRINEIDRSKLQR